MAEHNIFAEEWRRCLREHYKYVIRQHDKVTEKTLVGVLHRVGFTDDDLRQLYLEATLRTEDMRGDSLPDLHKLPYQMHPAECACAACMDAVLDIGHNAEGQPLSPDEVVPTAEPAGVIFAVAKPNADAADEDKPEAPKDTPRQMSMF